VGSAIAAGVACGVSDSCSQGVSEAIDLGISTITTAANNLKTQQTTTLPMKDPLPASMEARSSTSGESSAAQDGRRAHENYGTALGEGYDTKAVLDDGSKPDAVNWEKREVRELKSDHPKATAKGQRQVEKYRQQLEKQTGEKWTSEVDVYKRKK
jgi:hypothetical protein